MDQKNPVLCTVSVFFFSQKFPYIFDVKIDVTIFFFFFSDWEQSFIVCLYKGKGDAFERGNYHSLKLIEQVMEVLERIVDGLIRHLVSIYDSQFGFVPGRGTTAIFVVRQLQEKYLAANKRLYIAFVDLEKAFD